MKSSETVVRGAVALCLIAALVALGSNGPQRALANAGEAESSPRAAGAERAINADFEAGLALVKAGDAERAYPLLATAAADEPGVFGHQFAAATVALRLKKGPEGWRHLRKAVRLNPGDTQAAQMFTAIWQRFDAAGTLNAGVRIDATPGMMGEPDARREQGDVVRLEYGFMALDYIDGKLFASIDLRGLPIEAIRPAEQAVFKLDGRAWRLGSRQVSRVSVSDEYVLPNQSVQKYDEMFSVQRTLGLCAQGVTPHAFMERMRERIEQLAPGTKWRVLEQSPDRLTYEFIVPEGAGQPAQHEVARLIAGKTDMHRVAYVRIGQQMGEGERDKWVNLLRAATLEEREVAAAGE